MDSKIKDLKVLKIARGHAGTLKDFKGSLEMVEICEQMQAIAKSVLHGAIKREPVGLKDRYTNHLCRLATAFLKENPSVRSWDDFRALSCSRQSWKVLWDFGVKSAVFDAVESAAENTEKRPTRTRVTVEEVYELCRIRFNYSGSLTAFRRQITEHYGSFAEYCLQKGYDLNQTKWEDKATAMRCARKIGTAEAIKSRSVTLFNYLNENRLLELLRSA
jgi:hypothetical protein